VLAQWKRLMQVVETYIDAVRALDQVSGIFANDSHGLTVYTVYRGDRRQARAAIYDAYQEIMNRFPDILIDFHTVTCNNAEAAPISEKE
jgi:multidrug efflux pump subunit AcrB